MMDGRLGVIADVHGNAFALDAVLRDARQRGVERLVDLGDTTCEHVLAINGLSG